MFVIAQLYEGDLFHGFYFSCFIPFARMNTNNMVERQFRTIKEDVLNRTTAYNAVHLAEFIAVKYVNVIYGRLLDYAHSRKKLVRCHVSGNCICL